MQNLGECLDLGLGLGLKGLLHLQEVLTMPTHCLDVLVVVRLGPVDLSIFALFLIAFLGGVCLAVTLTELDLR